MAATRIRKVFKYDGDQDTTPWILDEEGDSTGIGAEPALMMTNIRLEQEKVITEIRLKDEELNEKFKVFSVI